MATPAGGFVRLTRPVAPLVLALFLAALQAVSAGPATLYFHVADAANTDSIPMNVLAPPANLTFRGSNGLTAATFSCTASAGGPAQESHTLYGIAYAAATNDAQLPQVLRGEARGLAYATALESNMTLHWYLETSSQAGGPADTSPAPVPLANVVVRATVREGEDSSAGASGYELGALIAQGESAPATLAGPQTIGAGVDMVDGHYVYNFTVPLTLQSRSLTERGLNVRIDTYVDNPLCATTGGMAMAPLLLIHNSPGHRPRLDLSVAKPLDILGAEVTQSSVGIVHLRVRYNTVWGSYAVGNVTVQVDGPGPAENVTTTLLMPAQSDPNTKPASPAYFFWNWNAAGARAVAGGYTLNFTASDLLGNTAAGPQLAVQLEQGVDHPAPSSKASPATAPLYAVLALVVAVLRAQRKRE